MTSPPAIQHKANNEPTTLSMLPVWMLSRERAMTKASCGARRFRAAPRYFVSGGLHRCHNSPQALALVSPTARSRTRLTGAAAPADPRRVARTQFPGALEQTAFDTITRGSVPVRGSLGRREILRSSRSASSTASCARTTTQPRSGACAGHRQFPRGTVTFLLTDIEGSTDLLPAARRLIRERPDLTCGH